MAKKQATPPEPASADKVVEGLVARREQLQQSIIKFRFRWSFLIIACVIGTGANAAIDVASGTLSPATWYQGALVGAIFYLFVLGFIHAALRGDLIQTNRTLAGTDINKQISRIARPPRHRRKSVSEGTWRDRPLVVATGTAAATIALFFTAVIPTWEKLKDNEIAALKTEPTRLKSELDAVTGQLRRMESENVKLRRDLDRLSPDSLFSLDDVYPKGFRSVRIGDRIDLLPKVYGSEADIVEDESPAWIAVKFKNPHLFSQITYYYNEQATPKTVTMILFHFDNKDGRTFDMLKQQLIDKYSQSKMKEVKNWRHKTELEWSGINKHVITLGDGTLHIERSD
jgi:hypothetical protein